MPNSPEQAGNKSMPKDETDLLEVLSVLIETEKAQTTSDLLKYAAQYGAPEAEERLRLLEAENIPIDLAFDAISVHLRIMAHKRNSELLTSCRGLKVGLVLPLPRHVPELFMPVADVTVLEPAESSHHSSQQYSDVAVKGTRACRAKAQEMQALVFEAYREEGDLFVDPTVADVLEPKMLPAGIRLIAHLRPHENPGDLQIQPASEVSFI